MGRLGASSWCVDRVRRHSAVQGIDLLPGRIAGAPADAGAEHETQGPDSRSKLSTKILTRPRFLSASERGMLFNGRREKTFRKPSRVEAPAAGRLTLRL